MSTEQYYEDQSQSGIEREIQEVVKHSNEKLLISFNALSDKYHIKIQELGNSLFTVLSLVVLIIVTRLRVDCRS